MEPIAVPQHEKPTAGEGTENEFDAFQADLYQLLWVPDRLRRTQSSADQRADVFRRHRRSLGHRSRNVSVFHRLQSHVRVRQSISSVSPISARQ